ncbi:MAG TPA: hypothetical protein VFH69_09865 [Gemmatimonadota bacterium]|nr:hypothetical protein [Gemmatimonadota bacterium]
MTHPLNGSSILLAVFALMFHAIEVAAQDADPAGIESPWEVVVALGAPIGGPHDEIEAALSASGFDDSSIDVEHPFSTGSEVGWAASLRRRIRPRLDVELIATRATMGTTLGHHQVGLGFGHFLFLNQSVTTIAPIASFNLNGMHAGAGPALSRVRLERGDLQGESGSGDTEPWKVGILLDAGITLPRRSRLFFEGRGQYRWIPTTEAGPFVSGNGLPDDIPSTIPAVVVDMSHAYFSVGMGARF